MENSWKCLMWFTITSCTYCLRGSFRHHWSAASNDVTVLCLVNGLMIYEEDHIKVTLSLDIAINQSI